MMHFLNHCYADKKKKTDSHYNKRTHSQVHSIHCFFLFWFFVFVHSFTGIDCKFKTCMGVERSFLISYYYYYNCFGAFFASSVREPQFNFFCTHMFHFSS